MAPDMEGACWRGCTSGRAGEPSSPPFMPRLIRRGICVTDVDANDATAAGGPLTPAACAGAKAPSREGMRGPSTRPKACRWNSPLARADWVPVGEVTASGRPEASIGGCE